MNTPPRFRNRPHNHPAFAIPLALAATLLVSGIAVALFSRASLNRTASFSSANIAKTDQLATSALDIITAELLDEIRNANNSSITGSGSHETFEPKDLAKHLTPSIHTSVDPDETPNLLKLTNNTEPLWQDDSDPTLGGRSMASAIATTTPSLNDRAYTAADWQRNAMHAATETLISPSWVFVSRSNGIAAPATLAFDADTMANPFNANYIIGRFAAKVYNVSGLLDLNMAGHGSSLTTAEKAQLVGSLAAIDLVNYKTEQGNFAFGSSNLVDSLIENFRNRGTTSTAASYKEYLHEIGPKTGFLHPVNGDNQFLSRKDILRFARTDAAASATDNLGDFYDGQHLFTHFSRENNTPSWRPSYNADDHSGLTSFNYKDNENDASAANRFLPKVTVSNSFTRRDGTTAEVGEPLMKSRFPLNKLALITPTAITSTAIADYFGLSRTSADSPWTYRGNTPTILTLDQVASAGREPDFFELLKAGILSGSLGLRSDSPTQLAREDKYAESDFQILQIGAHIIDQYDEDHFPTALRLDTSDTRNAYGIENLPYINKIYIRLSRPSGGSEIHSWVQFDVWNPHAGAELADSTRPKTRIIMTSGQASLVARSRDSADDASKGGTDPTAPGGTLNPGDDNDGSYIDWNSTNTITYSSSPTIEFDYHTNFKNPTQLTSSLVDAPLHTNVEDLDLAPANLNTGGIGIEITTDTLLDQDLTGNINGDGDWTEFMLDFSGANTPLTFELQYQRNGNWYTYQTINSFGSGGVDVSEEGSTAYQDPSRESDLVYFASDPRTMRFGMQLAGRDTTTTTGIGDGYDNDDAKVSNYSNRHRPSKSGTFFPERTAKDDDDTSLAAGDYEDIYKWAFNTGTDPDDHASPYYKDPDGVQRFGDGYSGTANAASGDFFSGASLGSASVPATLKEIAKPVILNRSFRTVGDLGYAHRDLPWKTLDLFTQRSPDAGLLDLFAIAGESEMVAGKINLQANAEHGSGAPIALLQAAPLLDLPAASLINQTQAEAILTAMKSAIEDSEVTNSGDFALLLEKENITVGSGASSSLPASREAVVRALAGVSNSRTWNLMVDVVAQSGRYTRASSSLGDFLVEGERRYWMHLAIDRYTGKIIDRQIELAE